MDTVKCFHGAARAPQGTHIYFIYKRPDMVSFPFFSCDMILQCFFFFLSYGDGRKEGTDFYKVHVCVGWSWMNSVPNEQEKTSIS